MSARTAGPSVTQLCERTRQLLVSTARTQSVDASVKRELVIRELRFAAERRGVARVTSPSQRQIATH
ncbi:MAG TPA: hypothetical protein VHY18_14780 [Solirubrobacteraceae bacterium]|jgi:hypothetical protein|nr:hypothetical protein [Solirubrobacteraceae bacterium]